MFQIIRNWKVRKTSCFPNSWQVYLERWADQNAPVNFFRTEKEAKDEADRRNIAEKKRNRR